MSAWDQRKLAIVRDLALALSDGEWEILRRHFAETWESGHRVGAFDQVNLSPTPKPYAKESGT